MTRFSLADDLYSLIVHHFEQLLRPSTPWKLPDAERADIAQMATSTSNVRLGDHTSTT
jgi:hypothetical protein